MSRSSIAKLFMLPVMLFLFNTETTAIGFTPVPPGGVTHYVHKGEKITLYSFNIINMIDNNGDGVNGAVTSMAYDHWSLRYISFRQFFQTEGECVPLQAGERVTPYLDAANLHVGGVYTFNWSGVCDELPEAGPIGSRTCMHTSVQTVVVIPYTIPVTTCTAVNGSYGSVTLQWTSPTPLYCPIDHYSIFRTYGDTIRIHNLSQATLVTDPLAPSTLSIAINHAPRGARPYYVVVAFDAAGEAIAVSHNVQPAYDQTGFGLSSPQDGRQAPSNTPTLSWTGGVPPYTLWISSDANFTTHQEYSAIASLSFSLPTALADRSQWYWKITDSRGITGDESGWSFRTNVTPLQPATVQLFNPIAGSLVGTRTPSFTWSGVGTVGDSIVYHLQIANDPALTNIVVDVHTAATFFNLVDSLADDHAYYWQVRATGAGGAADWSTVESFELHSQDQPSAVQLVYPSWSQQMSGGPELPLETGLNPSFRWTHAEDPDTQAVLTYTLWYSTDPLFAAKVVVSAIADTEYTPVQPLGEDQIYYWQVFAVDQTGKATPSVGLPYAFVTNSVNSQPSTPVLTAPINGQLISGSNIPFTWSCVDNDLYDLKLFDVYVSKQRNLRDTISSIIGVYGSSCTLATLANGKYYWLTTVRSTTVGGLEGGANVSAVDSFEVSSSFIQEVTSPAANVSWDIASEQTIQWSVYKVDSVAIDYSTDAGVTWTLVADSLAASTGRYFWIVPNRASSNCLIRVRNLRNPLSYAVSHGVFSIHLSTPMLTDVVPRTQVRSSTINTRIRGYKLPADALTIKLTRPGVTDVVARDLVSLSPTTIQCTFDLPATTGIYHVIAATAAGNDTLPSYFTVQRPVVSDTGWTVQEILRAGNRLDHLAVADLNVDGLNEIYCIEQSGAVFQVVHVDTGWRNSEIANVGPPAGGSRNLVVSDADNDGRMEIYSSDNSNHIKRLSLNNGWQVTDLGAAAEHMSSINIADGNYDGKYEIYSGSGDWSVKQWTWNGTSLDEVYVGRDYSAVYEVGIGDGNNDHGVEIFPVGLWGLISSFKWNHTGFALSFVSDQGWYKSHWSIISADANNDGMLELYATCADGILYQYQATPGVNYATTTVGAAGYSVIAGDVDGDGLQELYTNGLTRFDWNGATWETTAIGGGGDRYLTIGDGDNDGALELLATTGDGRLLMYKLHEPAPASVTVTYSFPTAGWYMVSLAVVPQDRSVSTLFPNALGGLVYTWDPIQGIYAKEDTLNPQVGYWLATLPCSCSITGTTSNAFHRTFDSAGWQMIGPASQNIAVTSLSTDPDGMIITPLYGWDVNFKSYLETDSLFSQQGYWAAIDGACTMSSTASRLARVRKASPEFTAQFGAAPPGPPSMDWPTDKSGVLPTGFSLAQNFPNPFNPTTHIKFALPVDAHVDLVIYNALGRRVRNLLSEKKSAGFYTVNWDAADNSGNRISSGIYFIRIQAGDFVQTKKVLLLK